MWANNQHTTFDSIIQIGSEAENWDAPDILINAILFLRNGNSQVAKTWCKFKLPNTQSYSEDWELASVDATFSYFKIQRDRLAKDHLMVY